MMKASKSVLRSFLSNAEKTSPSYQEVRGFVFAVAGTPEMVPPSDWLSEAFNGEMPEFDDTKQAQSIVDELMDTYNAVVSGGQRIKHLAPEFRGEAISNLDEDAAVRQWSRGFLRGYAWLRDVWREFTPEELDEELASIVLVLTFFATPKMAEACCDETAQGKSLEEVAESMRRVFRDAMVQYAHLGQSIYKVRLQFEDRPVSPSKKTGRNAPCICGSGRKFKKCCGAV